MLIRALPSNLDLRSSKLGTILLRQSRFSGNALINCFILHHRCLQMGRNAKHFYDFDCRL